jgi:hypothetical protein
MTYGAKYIEKEGITWYCVSVFYAREYTSRLMLALDDFYREYQFLFTHCSFCFSERQGERVDIVITSDNRDKEFVHQQIDNYFTRFIREFPSQKTQKIRFGNKIWMDYPNNSIAWNAFSIPYFLPEYPFTRPLAHHTSRLIANLYDTESCYEENQHSIAAFLTVKLIKILSNNQLWKPVEEEYNDSDAIDNRDTLEDYWNYDETGELLTTWMEQTEQLCRQMEPENKNIIFLVVYYLLNIGNLQKEMIICMVSIWHKLYVPLYPYNSL